MVGEQPKVSWSSPYEVQRLENARGTEPVALILLPGERTVTEERRKDPNASYGESSRSTSKESDKLEGVYAQMPAVECTPHSVCRHT